MTSSDNSSEKTQLLYACKCPHIGYMLAGRLLCLMLGPEKELSPEMPSCTDRCQCVLQRLTGVFIHLVNKMMADVQRALWWQERTARHRYMLKLAAAESERQRVQPELAQKR